MRNALILGSFIFLVTACATGPRPILDASHKTTAEQQQDLVTCQASAGQASTGSGEMWSDRAMRAAAIETARRQHMAACLQSRGWTWKTAY